MQKMGYHDFPSKIFGLKVPKKVLGEPFCISKKFFYQKFLCIGGGGHHSFAESFLSHSAEKFRGNPYGVSEIFGYRKILCTRRGITIFCRRFLSHSSEKFHWGTLRCFRKILLSKILMHRRGASQFCRNFFVSQDRIEKLYKGTLLFSRKIWVSKKIFG